MTGTTCLRMTRLSWLWSLALGSVLLVSCRSAGALRGEHFVADARFEALAPEAPEWQLTTNVSTPFASTVEWTWCAPPSASTVRPQPSSSWADFSPSPKKPPPGPQGSLFVEVRPLPNRYRSLPLEVIAELRYMKRLGTLGGAPALESMQRIALDERAAMALIGSRLDRPFTWRHTLVVLASQGMLVELGYHTLEGDFERAAPAFERLLRQLKLTLPGPFDPNVLEETPFFYPWSPIFQGKAQNQEAQQPPIPHPGIRW